MSQKKERNEKSNEKIESAENKPQTDKGSPAELLYMGLTPIPGYTTLAKDMI